MYFMCKREEKKNQIRWTGFNPWTKDKSILFFFCCHAIQSVIDALIPLSTMMHSYCVAFEANSFQIYYGTVLKMVVFLIKFPLENKWRALKWTSVQTRSKVLKMCAVYKKNQPKTIKKNREGWNRNVYYKYKKNQCKKVAQKIIQLIQQQF